MFEKLYPGNFKVRIYWGCVKLESLVGKIVGSESFKFEITERSKKVSRDIRQVEYRQIVRQVAFTLRRHQSLANFSCTFQLRSFQFHLELSNFSNGTFQLHVSHSPGPQYFKSIFNIKYDTFDKSPFFREIKVRVPGNSWES